MISFVPTMGNLHEGHLALVRIAKARGGCAVASIFVNRLQFAPHEDFDRYPRTFEADCAKLAAEAVDVCFAPDEKELYPGTQEFLIEPPALAQQLEGEYRPGFFRGVSTVVLKLFNIVQPQVAVFGKKDYQQQFIVRNMVRQLDLPIEIVSGATVREADGLALSSRNHYLTRDERSKAPHLYRTLERIRDRLVSGRRDFSILEAEGRKELDLDQWNTDYVAVRKQADLQSPSAADRYLVVMAAATLGRTRLIDSVEFTLPA